MKRKILFVIAGLAAVAMVSCTDDSTADPKLCGNNVLDAGEACDGALGVPVTCADYNSTKTWQAGGAPTCGVSNTADACKILVGTCVEEGAVVVCGDGKKEGSEACDGADGVPATCADYDSSKTWQAGGAPACGGSDTADACKILIGSCVEEGVVVVCGDGVKEGSEVCDYGEGQVRACSEIDAKYGSGNAKCVDTCSSVDLSECVVRLYCGDGAINNDEECEPAVAVAQSCSDYDVSVEWQAGGKPACGAVGAVDECMLTVGSCVKEGHTVLCGDGVKEGEEVCDLGATQSIACSDIDAKYESGFAKCENQCKALNLSACVVKKFCGDGIINNDEQCEPSVVSAVTCADFDKSKTWATGGKPGCGAAETANACKLTQGSCVEQGHVVVCGDGVKEGSEVCDYGKDQTMDCAVLAPDKFSGGKATCANNCKNVDTSKCVEKTKCGNGIIEAPEVCDFGVAVSKNCSEIDPKYTSGQAICESCKVLNLKACAEVVVPTLEWCQLMPPTKIEFTNLVSEFKLNALVHVAGVTDKTRGLDTVNAPKATFVYGVDPKAYETWTHLEAKGDVATDHDFADNYTAKLTKTDMITLGAGASQAYYSFGFAMADSKDYVYCKQNTKNPELEDHKLGFITTKDDANTNVMGSAKVQNIIIDKILCEFNFSGLVGITATSVINANKGKCTIEAKPNIQCEAPCITTGANPVWNIKNWLKALDATKTYIIISANTEKASEIDLELKVWRNHKDSPDKIAVYYSTNGTSYTHINDIALNTAETELKKLIEYKVALPSGADNQAALTIKLAPYGLSTNALRFDDIIITKR